jgi:hypothetical protein
MPQPRDCIDRRAIRSLDEPRASARRVQPEKVAFRTESTPNIDSVPTAPGGTMLLILSPQWCRAGRIRSIPYWRCRCAPFKGYDAPGLPKPGLRTCLQVATTSPQCRPLRANVLSAVRESAPCKVPGPSQQIVMQPKLRQPSAFDAATARFNASRPRSPASRECGLKTAGRSLIIRLGEPAIVPHVASLQSYTAAVSCRSRVIA